METPSVVVIGAYRVPITDLMVEAVAASSEFPPDTPKNYIRQHLDGFTLLDLLVANAPADFDPWAIQQATTFSRNLFDTTFLSIDGKQVLAPPGEDLPEGIHHFRLAIYLHDFRAGEPLTTPYGEVDVPPVRDVPDGLMERTMFPFGD